MKKIFIFLLIAIFSVFILLGVGFGVKINKYEKGIILEDKDKYLLTIKTNLNKKKIYIKKDNLLYETKCEFIQNINQICIYSLVTHLVFNKKIEEIFYNYENLALFLYVTRKE